MPEHFPRPTQEKQPKQFPLTVAALFEHLPPEPTQVEESLVNVQKQSWTVGEGIHALQVEQRVQFLLVEAVPDSGEFGIGQKTIEYYLRDEHNRRLIVQIQFIPEMVGSSTMTARVIVFTEKNGLPIEQQRQVEQLMQDFAAQHISERYRWTPIIQLQVQPRAPRVDSSEAESLAEAGVFSEQ